jgi:hypothetical protein
MTDKTTIRIKTPINTIKIERSVLNEINPWAFLDFK